MKGIRADAMQEGKDRENGRIRGQAGHRGISCF